MELVIFMWVLRSSSWSTSTEGCPDQLNWLSRRSLFISSFREAGR
jgi:hypothetical protein